MSRKITKEQHEAIIRVVKEYMEEHPDSPASEAYEFAAKMFFKSPFTIRDICNKPAED